MKLTFLNLDDSQRLTDFYNEEIQRIEVPCSYPVSPTEFQKGLIWEKNPFKPFQFVTHEKLIVAEVAGQIRGFIHVGVQDIRDIQQADQEEPIQRGIIRFMLYSPGFREVGQTLLEEAERYFEGLNLTDIYAFNSRFGYFFFYARKGWLPGCLGHVLALVRMNKYRIAKEEVCLYLPDLDALEPTLQDDGLEISVKELSGGKLPSLKIEILKDGHRLGCCDATSIGKHQLAEQAQVQFYIDFLDVKEDDQGKGLGRYLLQKMHWEMQKRGYKEAFICTSLDNSRAILFYTNYGYRIIGNGYWFTKENDANR